MADPDEQRDIFLKRIGEALSPYQLIEEYLKVYIEAAHSVIELILMGRIPFRHHRSEYENAPLERLITMFSRHCDNEDLIKRLRAAVKKRNYVAHNVIGHYMKRRDTNPKRAHSISGDLKKIEDVGYHLVEELRNELSKLQSRAGHSTASGKAG
jgi:hypothetical protein